MPPGRALAAAAAAAEPSAAAAAAPFPAKLSRRTSAGMAPAARAESCIALDSCEVLYWSRYVLEPA